MIDPGRHFINMLIWVGMQKNGEIPNRRIYFWSYLARWMNDERWIREGQRCAAHPQKFKLEKNIAMVATHFLRRSFGLFLLFLLTFISKPNLPQPQAQMQTGDLYGKIILEDGSILPGVTITLFGQGAPQVQISSASGDYRFLFLYPGTYTMECELEGFNTVTIPNIEIRIGRKTTVEITMTPDLPVIIADIPSSALMWNNYR